MRTTQATPASSTTSSRAATVRASSIATAFLTGTAAISLLVAPAAAAAPLQSSAAAGIQTSVSTTWGHDDWKDKDRDKDRNKDKDVVTEKTVTWLMPDAPGGNIWPQKLVAGVPDCGTDWYQVDVYRYGTDAQKTIVDAFMKDGILEGPAAGSSKAEDHAAILRWSFQQPANTKAECTTPPVVETPDTTPPVVETPDTEIPADEEADIEIPADEEPVTVPPVDGETDDNDAPVVLPGTTTPQAPIAGVDGADRLNPPVSGVGSAFGETPAPTVVPRPSTATPPVAVVTEDGTLAVTGAKVGLLSALAAVLVAAGVVAFRISRRTRVTK